MIQRAVGKNSQSNSLIHGRFELFCRVWGLGAEIFYGRPTQTSANSFFSSANLADKRKKGASHPSDTLLAFIL